MKNLKVSLLIFGALVIASSCESCSPVSYTPYLVIDAYPDRLDARVLVRNFESNIPYDDRDDGFGTNLVEEDGLAGDLGIMVTNAMIDEFNRNSWFNEVGRKVENPDLTIEGELTRFYAKNKPMATYFFLVVPYLSILPILGVPIYRTKVELELTISIIKPNDIVRTYTETGELNKTYNIYKHGVLALNANTNEVMSGMMARMRDKIMKDKTVLESR